MKIENMPKLHFFDYILKATILPFIPRSVSPNNVTAFRFTTIPLVVYFLVVGDFKWGIVLFAISALSDGVDGALARTRNQITEWGKMYDPLADKLLIGTVVALVVSQILGHVLALVIIGLELLIIASAFYRKKFHGREISAKTSGKIKMVFQSVGVFLLLVAASSNSLLLAEISRWLLYAGVSFAILSIVEYSI